MTQFVSVSGKRWLIRVVLTNNDLTGKIWCFRKVVANTCKRWLHMLVQQYKSNLKLGSVMQG